MGWWPITGIDIWSSIAGASGSCMVHAEFVPIRSLSRHLMHSSYVVCAFVFRPKKKKQLFPKPLRFWASFSPTPDVRGNQYRKMFETPPNRRHCCYTPFCFDSTRQKSCFDSKRQKSCFDSKRQKVVSTVNVKKVVSTVNVKNYSKLKELKRNSRHIDP